LRQVVVTSDILALFTTSPYRQSTPAIPSINSRNP
jgi:hypothetical protein